MHKKILTLAFPNIITNITVPLLGMVDIAVAGHLGNDALIGGIAIGATIFNFIYWNFSFLRMSASGLTAQAYGAYNFPEIMSILVRGIFVALFFGVLLLFLQKPLGVFSMNMMHGSEETMSSVAAYFYIRIWSAPATISLCVIQGWFLGMQNARLLMYSSIFVNLVNIILCLWFSFGLDLGVMGIAWGSVIAHYTGLILAVVLWIMYYRRLFKYISLKKSLNMKSMLNFFRINRDIFLRTACIIAVYTFFTSTSSRMGETMLAVNVLLMQFFMIFTDLMDGFAYAGEALVGRYIGARSPDRLRLCVRYLLQWGLGIALLFVCIYAFAWHPLLSLFTSSEAILMGAKSYVIWLILIPLATFIPFIIEGILIGATQTLVMRNSMIISTAIFFGSYYAMRDALGNHALWLSFILFMVLQGVLQYLLTRRLTNLIPQPAS